jgi:DNA processing protein
VEYSQVSYQLLRSFTVALSLQKGIGPRTYKEIIENVGSIELLYDLARSKDNFDPIPARLRPVLSLAIKDMYKYESILEKYSTSFVCIWEKEYPKLLREIYDPPIVLYYRGIYDYSIFENTVSVVGTRKFSDYGMRNTEKFCNAFVCAGKTIVSGLALGIDSIAHKSAIQSGGKTIAVLASPAHIPSPISNKKMYDSIVAENGLIVSETFPNTKIIPGMFANRNRIVAGLSRSILVIQAPEKSGALITARLGVEYDREVFAIPGDIDRVNSAGVNSLISDGYAKLVQNPEEILLSFSEGLLHSDKKISVRNLTDTQQIIYDLLLSERYDMDEISVATGIEMYDIVKIVGMMEIEGHIAKDPTGKYIALV